MYCKGGAHAVKLELIRRYILMGLRVITQVSESVGIDVRWMVQNGSDLGVECEVFERERRGVGGRDGKVQIRGAGGEHDEA